VPRSAKVETDVAPHVADTAQVSFAPEVVTRRTTVKARKGESVASIAKRYGLSAANVAEWNHVSASSAFKMGQQVVVFLPVKSHAASASHGRGKAGVKAVKRGTAKPVVKTKKR